VVLLYTISQNIVDTSYLTSVLPHIVIFLKKNGYTSYFDIFFILKSSKHKAKRLCKHLINEIDNHLYK